MKLTNFIKKEIHKFIFSVEYSIEPIEQNASARKYLRIKTENQTFILCRYKDRLKEKDLVYISKIFKESGIKSVEIYKEFFSKNINFQKDLGSINLSQYISRLSTIDSKRFIKKIIKKCIDMNVDVHKCIDYSRLSGKSFNVDRIKNDVNNFNLNFLKKFNFDYSKGLEFETEILLAEYSKIPEDFYFFTHRDLNIRNILIKGEEIYFIDIQDGNKGPITYDIASLIVSSSFKDEFGESFIDMYGDFFKKTFYKKTGIDLGYSFDKYLLVTISLRLMQALGSYGKIYNKNIYSNDSIDTKFIMYLEKLDTVLSIIYSRYNIRLTEISKICKQRFLFYKSPVNLPVIIESFSYILNDPPILKKNSLNFVIDARLFDNPGRVNTLNGYTGKDFEILDFFKNDKVLSACIRRYYSLISIIRKRKYRYSERINNFRILVGCTGGKHRSVYISESLKDLFEKDGVRCSVIHNNI